MALRTLQIQGQAGWTGQREANKSASRIARDQAIARGYGSVEVTANAVRFRERDPYAHESARQAWAAR
jgi:hypothetical protein